MLLLAALLAYPVLRYAGPLIPGLFTSNSFGRAIAALFLYVFVIIAACAAALVALAVGMLRGSRVAQVLTVLLAAALALGVLINGQSAGQGSQTRDAASVIVVLTCLVVIALVTLPPSARAFFAQDRSPVGVLATATACAYFGWCVSVTGLVLTIAGAIQVKFVWWGALFVLVGAGLTALSRPLRGGHSWARNAATVGLGCYVLAGLVFAANGGDSKATGTVVQTALGLGALGLLWFPSSSTRHFATGPHPVGGRLTYQPISWLALGLVTTIFVGIGLSASDSLNAAATPIGGFSTPAPYAYPSSSEAPSAPFTPTVTAGTLNTTWTVQVRADGGYTEEVTLSVGAPEHFQAGLSQGQLVAGSACSIDAGTDAVIPAQLTETNTTSGFAAHTGTSFSFGTQWNSPAVEVRFTAGPQCETDGYHDRSTNKLQPQGHTSTDMFFVLSGYYTPDHPAGDPAVLANATLQFTANSITSDDGSEAVRYTPSTPSGAPVGIDGTIPLGGQLASTPNPGDSTQPSDPVSQPVQQLPGDLTVQVGPLDDGDCVGHTTGQLADYLSTNGCADMKRSMYTMMVDGRPAVISVATLSLSDPAGATAFAELSTRNGTGDVLTLLRDGAGFAGAPASFTRDPTYLAHGDTATGEVVVLQAMWNDGSPTHADDPSLAPMLAEIISVVA